jgi:hypothetical protein
MMRLVRGGRPDQTVALRMCRMPALKRPGRIVLHRIALGALTVLAVAGGFRPRAGVGQPATPEADPTGGLRSRSAQPEQPTGSSREELVRQWDLDRNGVIDPSEAAIARERMRRGRKEMQSTMGIDPLTGRPRDEGDAAVTGDDGTPPLGPTDLAPEPTKRAKTEPALPGTRVPDAPAVSPAGKPGDPPAIDGSPSARPRSSAAVPGTTGSPPNAGRGSGDGPRRQPGNAGIPTRPGTVTGGVRAGAPAARGGYGSLAPRTDLNAGRPRGGLLPTLRTGPTMRPGLGIPGVVAPVPAAPVPPSMRPPRIMADDIGGF